MTKIIYQCFLWISLLLVSWATTAANIATVTLENGATVVLKDDFTWEYVILTKPSQPEPQVAPAIAVAPQASVSPRSGQETPPAATLTNQPPHASDIQPMSADHLLQSGLLASAAKDGVKVRYEKSTWRDDELGMQFELASNNSDGVVTVEVEVTFYDDAGHQLDQQVMKAWQASYRQPETYLRKGQTRSSRIIWVENIDKRRWKKEMLRLKVLEVDTR